MPYLIPKNLKVDHEFHPSYENYELTFIQAVEFKDENVVIDKKVLEGLKREIRNLGNVNIDSIKEYEDIKERYDFYSEQKQDLEESIDVIEKLIADFHFYLSF